MKEHAKQIAEAINLILDDLVARERQPRPSPLKDVVGEPFKLMTLSELDKHVSEGHYFIEDPIGRSLRLGIRDGGKILARTFDLATMHEVADFIGGQPGPGIKADILDKAWDGIEDKNGNVWVA